MDPQTIIISASAVVAAPVFFMLKTAISMIRDKRLY
jgi:hypothetical protein